MKTLSKSIKENQDISFKKGISLEFFSAYQDIELERMMGLCDPEGTVSFVPLGNDFIGKIHEIGKGVWAALLDSFPDLDNTVIEQEYEESQNAVFCKVEIFGTQEKDFAGLPAKGKPFRSEHIFIFKFTEEDKIMDIQIDWDHESFVRQLS
ncbi:ester cyclase [Cognataquiflexum rubidum]|uniref:ester cyclase n=1 Tax=Cognataquiflexum rubidum TaxID=2922273 RepID=UPI001F12BA40|nr:ester cyclase [Cognataquiflexum rubidum]MCH6234960.1 ester cyclase [Cognataquiflexum rubidum]